jgi:hypothetical protein
MVVNVTVGGSTDVEAVPATRGAPVKIARTEGRRIAFATGVTA